MNTADTLADWQARQQEVEARQHEVGVARPDQVVGRSGLQILQAMVAGELPRAPISRTLGFVIVDLAEGRAVFQGQPKFDHYNPLGTVHGGWIATLLDSAVGCAVHTLMEPGKTYTTLELKINYVKAITHKVPLVRAVGEVIHRGGRIATAEGRLVGADGTLYAHATTTCLIFEAQPPTKP
ncbi:PaaI family thioesterase [Aquincola tertiaricarbonis]|uniref:PaaI family thioesterase n=1 Tax=Aquincola tertiaricarbonis TaxID=391953 RepID=A0ABY4S0N6_AQUTE|nr:PaaI family thioesterase [Aquincola tertiaricarbonis]URI06070.1 PaaI family thioesterase [Aquincola tertiaricarbonis]